VLFHCPMETTNTKPYKPGRVILAVNQRTTLSTRHEIQHPIQQAGRCFSASLRNDSSTPWRARIHFPMFLTDYFREGVLDVGAETDRFLLSAEDSGSFGKTFARYHGAANVPALQCKSEVGSLDKVSVITRTPFRLCRGFNFRARPPSS